MRCKYTILLPVLAVFWFWTLATYEHRINTAEGRSVPGISERFGCGTLYHTQEDRVTAERQMYPFELDCHESARIRLFAVANFLPLILSAGISIALNGLRHDEVVFSAVLVTSALILFWGAVGAYIDRPRRARSG
jgi:hypothetical protein